MSNQNKRYKTFLEMLKSQDKDSPALVFDEGNEIKSLTYGEFVKKILSTPINKSANSVGIVCENNLETVLNIFAYVNAKKQVVLLNSMDHIDLLKAQVQAADVDYLVGRKDILAELSPSLVNNSNVKGKGNILFFTSGTTMNNKAVVLTEKSLCASAYNGGACLPLEKSDTLLSILPLSHVFGFVWSLLWGLSFGVKVALGRGYRHLLVDGAYFQATVISLVPQMAAFMAINKTFNKELRMILIGAGPCPKTILDLIKASHIRVSFGYGLTETSSGVALSIGDDPEAMTICPDDKIQIASDGEILISSPTCMMQGYYKNSEETNKTIIDGYLHTGDLGKIDENGLLHITGRKKDILLLSDGTKIFCPQYEGELLPLLPKSDFAIALIENQVQLFIKTEMEQKEVDEKIQNFNLSKPRGQRISKINFVMSALPRTQTGKIKRWALKELTR